LPNDSPRQVQVAQSPGALQRAFRQFAISPLREEKRHALRGNGH
jgi:hypothetical protein